MGDRLNQGFLQGLRSPIICFMSRWKKMMFQVNRGELKSFKKPLSFVMVIVSILTKTYYTDDISVFLDKLF